MSLRPQLAALVMQTIAVWSAIDHELTVLMTRFLKAEFVVVNDLLNALSGSSARMAALRAVANSSLSADDNLLFLAVMKIVSSARKRRNEFVHGMWATIASLPDALLLVDPKHLANFEARIAEYQVASGAPAPIWPEDKLMVFSEGDIRRDLRDARQICSIVGTFKLTFLAPLVSVQVRSKLLEEPLVKSALRTLSSASSPESPPQ